MSENQADWKSRETEKLISDIREEVNSQKSCITQYSFWVFAICSGAWGVIFKAQLPDSVFYGSGLVLITLLLAVVRMANHKYGTINRNLGYELHLYRLKDYESLKTQKWMGKMMNIGWEEAMCAWRIVQPTVFKHYYSSGFEVLPYRIRKEWKNVEYIWFATGRLTHPKATYQPGNYLRNVHRLLQLAAMISLTALYWSFIDRLKAHGYDGRNIVISIMLGLITVFFLSRFVRERSYRKILEEELLSIQSNAVVWRLVVITHILASEFALFEHKSYQNYTKYTSEIALTIVEKHDKIHDWFKYWDELYGTPELYNKLRELSRKLEKNEKFFSDQKS